MHKLGMAKLDLYLAAVTFLFPMGWSLSGFPPNIILACICWAITWVLLIHAFWIFEKTANLHAWIKSMIVVFASIVLILLAWRPVAEEYRREHFIIDKDKFLAALEKQERNRLLVRIGCAPADEESCVIGGRFLDFFREAGWQVEGNEVQRVQLGKPEPGILIFAHGGGELDPDDFKSGLWVLLGPSLTTIQAAFTEIGLATDVRADATIPDTTIGIYFGYNAVTP